MASLTAMSLVEDPPQFVPMQTVPHAPLRVEPDGSQIVRQPELDLQWYRDSFLSRPHYTYLAAATSPPPPVPVSATEAPHYWDGRRRYPATNTAATAAAAGASTTHTVASCVPMAISISLDLSFRFYDVVLHTEHGFERLQVPVNDVRQPFHRKLFGLQPRPSDVITSIADRLPVSMRPRKHRSYNRQLFSNLSPASLNATQQHQLKQSSPIDLLPCNDPTLAAALGEIEDRLMFRAFKFGVGFIRKDQTTESEMLNNRLEHASANFLQFLQFLGHTIVLKGWQGYRGGLDVVHNRTGTHSVFTKWMDYDIMFHVVPMLPWLGQHDTQRIERKRHIGNDIVLLIFNESSRPFDISTITSKQTHVVVVVRPIVDPVDGSECYDMTMVMRREIPDFPPALPSDTMRFSRSGMQARNFLLTKLVNGERAALHAPIFETKLRRARRDMLERVVTRYLDAASMTERIRSFTGGGGGGNSTSKKNAGGGGRSSNGGGGGGGTGGATATCCFPLFGC